MLRKASVGLATLSVIGFLFCTVALGQDAATKPDSLAEDYVVGNWTAEGTVDGKAVKGSMRVRPAAGGTCLIYNWSHGSSQDDMVRGLAVGGRDPKTTDFLEYSFESNGSHFINRYPGEAFPDTGVGYGERTGTAHGKPYKGKITVDRISRDHFIYTVVSEQGVDEEFAFRRVQDEQAVSPVYEHLKDLEDFVGIWVAEDTLTIDRPGVAKKGETMTYRASNRWIHNKSILQMDFLNTPPDGKTSEARWNFGWDAVNKKIVYSGFDTDGGRVWGETKKESPDKWIWTFNWSGADGVQGSNMTTTTILDNANTHVHEFTSSVVDGNPLPDGKLVYKRVK